jgi:signal transduction histidine kinase
VASAATEVLSALLFASVYFRRPIERPFGIASLLAAVAAARSIGVVALAQAAHPIAAAGRLAYLAFATRTLAGDLALLVALALAVHFMLLYAGRRVTPWLLVALYTAAVAVPLIQWAAVLAAHDSARVVTSIGLMARDHGHRASLPLATQLAGVAAAAVTLFLASQAYLRVVEGSIAIVFGSTGLAATALNDAGVAAGWLSSGSLLEVGIAVFVAAAATIPGAGYAAVAGDLERRTQELQTRTRELRRSYEDLRTAQEELLKKEQLAVVGELAAVIAHEVRNPLAVIANAGAGLRKPAISREDHDVLLAILDEETSRLNRLVSDLLRYARPVSVQRTHLALRDLLERALAVARAGTKVVHTDLQMEAHEGRLWGDANLLRQVFDNLIDNAIQAMSNGGRLTIRVRACVREGIDGLGIDIIDTGEGMDTQVRSRALDPFFTTRPSGTGLGLAIVDRIIEAHGGGIDIDSRAGEGTTVTVFLPHGSPSDPPPVRSRPRPAPDLRTATADVSTDPPLVAGEATR